MRNYLLLGDINGVRYLFGVTRDVAAAYEWSSVVGQYFESALARPGCEFQCADTSALAWEGIRLHRANAVYPPV